MGAALLDYKVVKSGNYWQRHLLDAEDERSALCTQVTCLRCATESLSLGRSCVVHGSCRSDCGRVVFAAVPLLRGEQAQNSAVENIRPAAPRCGSGPQAVQTGVCRGKNQVQRESGRGSVPLRPAAAGGRGLCAPLDSEAGASPARRGGGGGRGGPGRCGAGAPPPGGSARGLRETQRGARLPG